MAFRDRVDAGRIPASRPGHLAGRDDVVVLGRAPGRRAGPPCEEPAVEADEVVCVGPPRSFQAVGRWYEDLTQTTDEEIRALLDRHPAQRAVPARKEDHHGE